MCVYTHQFDVPVDRLSGYDNSTEAGEFSELSSCVTMTMASWCGLQISLKCQSFYLESMCIGFVGD